MPEHILTHLTPFGGECGKVIQMYVRDGPVVCTGNLYAKHYPLLKEYLENNGLEYELMQLTSKSLPKPTGPEYRVIGMGQYMKMDNDISVFDFSRDYSLAIDNDHIEKIRPQFPTLTITIDF